MPLHDRGKGMLNEVDADVAAVEVLPNATHRIHSVPQDGWIAVLNNQPVQECEPKPPRVVIADKSPKKRNTTCNRRATCLPRCKLCPVSLQREHRMSRTATGPVHALVTEVA